MSGEGEESEREHGGERGEGEWEDSWKREQPPHRTPLDSNKYISQSCIFEGDTNSNSSF